MDKENRLSWQNDEGQRCVFMEKDTAGFCGNLSLDKFVGPDLSRTAKKRYKGKNIIDDVEFEIKEDEGDRKSTD